MLVFTKNNFSSLNRLSLQRDFNEIFEKGDVYKFKNFVIYTLKYPEKLPRLGIKVSKRIAKLSVFRNKLKRWARYCFRVNKEKLDSLSLILIYTKVSDINFNDFNKNFQEFIKCVHC